MMNIQDIDLTIGEAYMTHEPRDGRVLLFEDDDFSFLWDRHEINDFRELWNAGHHIDDISRKLKRDQDEVAILIIWLVRHGRLKKRKGGVLGNAIP